MKNSILSYKSWSANWAAFLLRLIFGGIFTYIGYIKVASYHKILPLFGDIIGIGARLSFNLVIFAELVCGFFVAIGFFTRLSVVPIFISMIVVFFIAEAKQEFLMKQYPFVLMLLCIVVFILGSGRISVDRMIQKRRPSAGRQMV